MKKEILSRLILEHVKVTWEGKVGNYAQFVTYKMTFWLALTSWLLKVPIDQRWTGWMNDRYNAGMIVVFWFHPTRFKGQVRGWCNR